ncbi:HlyD family efflux transporter periplasmic adaptor subunit [Persicimonas caeni]|uniref:HlyD family efflux transporter periplasmic adaptor subunit n=1 Tax=Persicimonas caeni TaxID=2292766 RepID=A0A4Y6PYV6_PERCE|nr:HlyD family efflux transporter periplasmic adaptor subunit [Persicimonas caeni]QDG53498.1 HlyD family efflux transporter periplasmic adaptor subunit [Persicimonas caeni]QED34719.1 HlyD family efflux transporter periplasmic adaptor subunit [Persicimonas caeni]
MSLGMNVWAKRILWGLVGLVVLGAIVWAFLPGAVLVDVGRVDRDVLQVTVSEDGQTRVIDRYTVTAPLTGQLERIELDEGDAVRREQTLARIAPVAPPLLDVRTRAEAEARVAAAEAAVSQAQAAAARARDAYEFSRAEARRQEKLLESGVVTGQVVDEARLAEKTAAADMKSARFSVAVARNELELARTALRTLTGEEEGEGEVMEVESPVDAEVLKVVQESEGVVQMGAPLVELGDLGSLEVIVDVLTTDAVAVEPGDPVRLVRWGGEQALEGRVKRVDPSAFTKISSLGVEEQRVDVVVALTDPRARQVDLGDGFRVEADIITWQGSNVLQVDSSAVFRAGAGWAVYRIVDGEAQLTPVEVGRRTERKVQVLDGLGAGDEVVLYPTDAVGDGVDVEVRGQ